MICQKCGTNVRDDAVFCPNCGSKMAGFPRGGQAVPQQAAPNTNSQPPAQRNQLPPSQRQQSVPNGYPQGYQQPQMPPAPTRQGGGTKTMAIASMVCGIVGTLLSMFVPFHGGFIGVILGIVACVCYSSALKKGQGGGLAVTGLVCGIIAIVFGIGSFLCVACLGVTAGGLSSLSSLS